MTIRAALNKRFAAWLRDRCGTRRLHCAPQMRDNENVDTKERPWKKEEGTMSLQIYGIFAGVHRSSQPSILEAPIHQ